MAVARIARRREAAASHLARLLPLVAIAAAAGCSSPASSAPDTACTQGYLRCWNNAVQTCGADRQWGSSRPCANQACVSGACAGQCTPGLTQCNDAAHVQTCDAYGAWGDPWPCATGACDDGACAGATTDAPSCAAQGPGLSDCGPDHESCCTSLEVPAGTWTDPGTANQYAIYGGGIDGRSASYYPGPGLQATSDFSNIAPVGTAAAGTARWGQLDLAGELMQWTLDAYATYVPCTNCAYLSGEYRVDRGGSFLMSESAIVPPYRGFDNNAPQDLPFGGLGGGLRCARTP